MLFLLLLALAQVPATAPALQPDDARLPAARAHLDSLPLRHALRERLDPLLNPRFAEFQHAVFRGELLFTIRTDPPRSTQRVVILKTHIDPAREKAILDLSRLDAPRSVQWISPSHDGRMVAICLLGHDGQSLTIHETDTGIARGVPIKGPLGHGLAWNLDSDGFHYVRQAPNQPPAIFFHPLGGHPNDDEPQPDAVFPPGASVSIDSAPTGDVLASTSDFPLTAWFLRPGGQWVQSAAPDNQISRITFGRGEALFFITRRGAPLGRVGFSAIESPIFRNAEFLTRPADADLRDLLRTQDHVLVLERRNHADALRLLDLHAQDLGYVGLPQGSLISALVPIGDEGVLIRHESLLTPRRWSLLTPSTPVPERSPLWGLRVDAPANAEILPLRAADLPVTVLRTSETPPGPCVLVLGHDGSPRFDPARTALLERRIAVALAPRVASADAIESITRQLVADGIAAHDRIALLDLGGSARPAIDALRKRLVAAAAVAALGDGPAPAPPDAPLLLTDPADPASRALASDRILLAAPRNPIDDDADRFAFLLNAIAPR